jgi:hypothetical protein
VAIAAKALTNQGVVAGELQKHVIALKAKDIVTVITSPTAIPPELWQRAQTELLAQGFEIMLGPSTAFDSVTSKLLSDDATAEFFDAQPEYISPSTDDKPFFFYTSRFGDWLGTGSRNVFAANNNNLALISLPLTLVGAFAAFIFYVIVPFRGIIRSVPGGTLATSVVYFCAIGMGFMLIEISQLQRLMVFLGHPVYGLSVVLFTLLLFGGLGSSTISHEVPSRNQIVGRALGLMVALIGAGLLTPPITALAKSYTTEIRILVSILLLAPPAFFMGMMFPIGMSICRRTQSELMPFLWGANGVASVLASVLGVVISMEFGITFAYAFGCLCYVICVLTLPEMTRRRTA